MLAITGTSSWLMAGIRARNAAVSTRLSRRTDLAAPLKFGGLICGWGDERCKVKVDIEIIQRG